MFVSREQSIYLFRQNQLKMRTKESRNCTQEESSIAIGEAAVALHVSQTDHSSNHVDDVFPAGGESSENWNGNATCKNPLHPNKSSSVSHLSASDVLIDSHHNESCVKQNQDKQGKVRIVSASSSGSPKEGITPQPPSIPTKDSHHSSEEFVTKVPPSFTIDVKSALDHVLTEFKQGDGENSKGIHKYGSDRPCILQQPLMADYLSSGRPSGASTPGLSNSGEVFGYESKDDSHHVEASMMLPEDSLTMIAQMSVTTKNESSSPEPHSGKEMPQNEEVTSVLQSKANHDESENSGHKTPLIAGTAAAAMDAMQRNSNLFSGNNGIHQSLLTSQALKKPKLIEAECKEAENLNPVSMNFSEENSEKVKRHEKGMDMLADIISHAVPISSTSKGDTTSCNSDTKNISENTGEQIEIPVGQSLSVYSKIAKDAGIATHTPLPLVHSRTQEVDTIIDPGAKQNTNTSHHNDIMLGSREIGKIRRYIAATGEFSEWEDLPCQTYGGKEPRRWNHLNIDESIEIPLRRGGRLRVFPNFLADIRRDKVASSMNDCNLYRQYCRHGESQDMEQRTQVLLSSQVDTICYGRAKNCRPGYQYEGITMMAQPLSHVPQIDLLAGDLAELYRLPEKEWNIGATLVCYRNGEDHMTWSSNVEQGEVLILCIIVESQTCTRPILIRPKDNAPLQDGDEEIIVFVGQGDAYEMDGTSFFFLLNIIKIVMFPTNIRLIRIKGTMQLYYEHCIPKKEDDPFAKRTVVVFRHGKQNDVMFDTGIPVFDNDQTDVHTDFATSSTVNFGHPSSDIIEGKEVYTKEMLIQSGAHHFERRWVSGTMRDGCDSILVERQDLLLREDDGLCWLQITSARHEGGAALYQSFTNKTPIRVFRSSDLDSRYAPDVYQDEVGQTLYRYDGLYAVKAIWDSDGDETDEAPSSDGLQYTFLLTRYPKVPADESIESEMNYNRMSVQELWNEIQKRRQILKPRPFQFSHPITSLAPIGDKSNLTRRRKDVIELPSETNSKQRKKRKKNLVNTEESEESKIVTDCEVKSAQADTDSLNIDQPGKKPKRASAAAARSYLQEAMQNKFGSQEKEKKFISSERDDASSLKRSTNNKSSEESVSSDDHHFSDKGTKVISVPIGLQSHIADTEESISVSSTQISDMKRTKRTYTRRSTATSNKGTKRSRSSPDSRKAHLKKQKLKIDPSVIEVGNRIHVDYKNILYKATVRKIRVKNNVLEFSVHYDGNKKSNVRWINAEMINGILPGADNTDEVKSNSRIGQPSAVTKMNDEEDYESIQDQETLESNEGVTSFSYQKGDMVYVDYKNVLYHASIQRTRINRKGVQEYLVHYDGFKRTSDRWLTADSLFDINEESTDRYKMQRGEESFSSKANMTSSISKGKNLVTGVQEVSTSASPSLDMGKNEPGVDFLPGSCVFVVRDDALYLAKMLKRRGKAPDMDYLIHYDGSSDNYDSWVPIHLIYEINPRTRRIYESTSNKRDPLNDGEEDDESDEESDTEDGKVLNESPGRRTARSKNVPTKSIKSDEYSKTRRSSPQKSDIHLNSSPTNKKPERKRGKNHNEKMPKLLEMTGIEAGVEFLPGSTVFIVWKDALYLGKMLKKRGKGADMEYFVHYDGFRKSSDAWVSASMIYEINPQTKRAFNKQKKQK